ncbi:MULTISPECIES: TerB family tellurite resistance protein [Corallococcus]|nr:TerB family tellurite resistance protein [Corallococcus sp. BB11-1]
MLGLLIGGPWAIVLALIAGVALGHYFDEQNAPPPQSPELFSDFPTAPERPPPRRTGPMPGEHRAVEAPEEDPLDHAIVALFMDVARADGELRREEVREIRRYFEEVLHADAFTVQSVGRYLKQFIARPASLKAAEALAACQEALPADERLRLLDALYEMALADGHMQRSETEVLRRMADGLGIPDEKIQALARQHLGDATPHFESLGLKPDATNAEVKAAFRKLAAAHHPDKSAGLGPKATEKAARRFQEIRDAYETIRKLRDL